MMTQARKLRDRLLGPSRPVELLVRNVLSFGFLVLLLLVVGLSYRSIQSLRDLEQESVRVDETEERHFRLVLDIKETVGKIFSESRDVVGTEPKPILGFASRRHLGDLRKELEAEIEQAQDTSLIESEAWAEFESSNKAFWAAINTPAASDDWYKQRARMDKAAAQLKQMVDKEREDNNIKAHQMSVRARNKIIAATGAVLGVGLVVAVLAFYEIRKNLSKLADAYASSAKSRDYLQSLLDSLVSGVAVIGRDGIVQTMSDSFRRLPGLQIESGSSQSYRQVFQNNASLLAAVEEQLARPSPKYHHYGHTDLGSRQFDISTSPLVVAGEQQGIILVFVDVTDKAHAQAELLRNRALTAVGQMTAQIAHEIKNPLGSIRFATEFLKRQGTRQTGALSTIQVIERSVDHLAAIVTELSEFARPRQLNRSDISLNELLDELLPMVADRVNAKQMEITREYSHDLPRSEYDATELKKLFLNLIINAIEASEPRSSIVLRTKLDGDRQVLIEIVDRGAGMDAETQQRLFEPFYTTKEKGTGLGMAISKQIAELHSGDLTVMSRVGAGTTATVRLPLTKSAEADNKITAVQRLSR